MSRVFCETWDSTAPSPLRILGAPRPGRARLQSCRKPRREAETDAHTTVEERRFSAASRTPKATGLQPRRAPFPRHMLRDMEFHGPHPSEDSEAPRPGRTRLQSSRKIALSFRAEKDHPQR